MLLWFNLSLVRGQVTFVIIFCLSQLAFRLERFAISKDMVGAFALHAHPVKRGHFVF